MKKVFLSLFVIGSFGLYIIYYGRDKSVNLATPQSLPSPDDTVPGTFKNGEYTGNRADAYYGYIQVTAVIKNNKLADVAFLEFPNDTDNSVAISAYAMPILKTEAIRAQSAEVDIVSGATDSSKAFRESLADALLQAK
ncbi:MAG TPA: FMN-binding protein [Candidatus Paceibacterota bacterium]